MTDKSIDVFGVGTILVDDQMIVEATPEANSKGSAVARRTQVGGPVPTALAMLTTFGRRCGFLGRWSNDAQGTLIEDDLRMCGIEFLPDCGNSSTATGTAHVWVNQTNGDRTIVAARGEEIPAHAVLPEIISAASAIHLDGWPEAAALKTATLARSMRKLVFLDAGSPKPGFDTLLPIVDVLICPQRTALAHWNIAETAHAAKKFLDVGPKIVAVTNGERGAEIHTDEVSLRIPAIPINTRDTNGAGDVFAGAFIHGVLQHTAHCRSLAQIPVAAVAEFAAAAAAIKCERLGNRNLPSEAEVRNLLTAG